MDFSYQPLAGEAANKILVYFHIVKAELRRHSLQVQASWHCDRYSGVEAGPATCRASASHVEWSKARSWLTGNELPVVVHMLPALQHEAEAPGPCLQVSVSTVSFRSTYAGPPPLQTG